MGKSIFWYDFESTGIDPRRDRPLQVAGIRTDENLEEIGEPLCIDCRLSDDTLPHPMACLVTGIGPARATAGLAEAEFIEQLHRQMAEPGTCTAGYNSLRFDDEMTRFTLYRNFYDPYAREWQGGNSRWDLLDALRTAQALRPEGIVWPEQDGLPSLRLELLTRANGIDHGQAHDALADVRATIAMARLLRQAQPRLYQYLYDLRSKHKVCELIDLQRVRPLVHVSGRFGRERSGLAVVLPLAWHPVNRNALIVYDLAADPDLLIDLDAETLRELMYTRTADLTEGQQRPGLKLVHINKCPVLADIKVLREEDIQRLSLNMTEFRYRAETLAAWRADGQKKLHSLFNDQGRIDNAGHDDCELQLYGGFMSDADRAQLDMIRQAGGEQLDAALWPLGDQRLVDMLPRYRARNFPQSLSEAAHKDWSGFCKGRLEGIIPGASITLPEFLRTIDELLPTQTGTQKALLLAWQEYAKALGARLRVSTV
ncbi:MULTISPECIES: exodeoxyribonuclease I [Pseudomonas]|uniref:exodeoxyribonuclease I n=1 Tax=Pseudomonas TaxID=286 RepID=UPI0012394BA6|nr:MULTISPECIES: exodeoxyribonuclease I [Pseudomonas]QIB52731.1 exodeoxyribonuclease I [Pseudomonas sp. OIL-1]